MNAPVLAGPTAYTGGVTLVLLAAVAFLVGFDVFTWRPRPRPERPRLNVDLRRRS